jgi:hypothetical protein
MRTSWLVLSTLISLTDVTLTAQERANFAESNGGREEQALISGRVVDAQSGLALARATVRLIGDASFQAVVTTGVEGEFTKAVPAGNYLLATEHAGYLAATLPQRTRTVRGTARTARLTVRSGQRLEGLTIRMTRGSVITGRVVDSYGEPVEAAEVRALSIGAFGNAEPRMHRAVPTNDVGEFRISRLESGSYIVLAVPHRGGQSIDGGSLLVTTFYPNAPSIEQAQRILVAPGSSAGGIQITLLEGALSTVDGTVQDVAGQPVRGGSVTAVTATDQLSYAWTAGSAPIKADGTFQLIVPSGNYNIQATTSPRTTVVSLNAAASPQPQIAPKFGTVQLMVNGERTVTSITVSDGAKASGRITFESTNPQRAGERVLRVLPAIAFTSFDGKLCRMGSARTARDLTFTVDGLFGTCSMRVNIPASGWVVNRASRHGVDLLDRAVLIEPGADLTDIEVIVSDRHNEVSLIVTGNDGRLTRDYVAVVFSVDHDRWNAGSRFVRTFVPPKPASASGGRAVGRSDAQKDVVQGLPPGEYFAVALDDLAEDATRDRESLQALSRFAIRLSVGDDTRSEARLQLVRLESSR